MRIDAPASQAFLNHEPRMIPSVPIARPASESHRFLTTSEAMKPNP